MILTDEQIDEIIDIAELDRIQSVKRQMIRNYIDPLLNQAFNDGWNDADETLR